MATALKLNALTSGTLMLAFALEAASAPVRAEPLSVETLQKSIPGSRINLDTPLGSVVPIAYGTDGSLEGSAGAVAFFLGSSKDRGRWWIEDAKVCHQWKVWFNGDKKCFRIELKSNSRIEWTDQDGDKGTGTIVSLGTEAQKPQQQVAANVERPAAPPPAMHVAAPSTAVTPSPSVAAAPMPPAKRPEAREPRSAAIEIAPSTRSATTAQPVSARPAVSAASPRAGGGNAKAPANAARDLAVRAVPVEKAEVRPGRRVAALDVPPPVAKSEAMARSSDATFQLASARTYSVVNVPEGDVLNVRRGPSAETEIVATIAQRATGIRTVGECQDDWCPVRSGHRVGWVHRYFIWPDAPGLAVRRPPPQRDARDAITYRVVRVPYDDVLNMRRQADGDSAIVGSIPSEGKRIRMTGYCVGEWCPVSHGQSAGWVNRRYLAIEF